MHRSQNHMEDRFAELAYRVAMFRRWYNEHRD